MSRKLLSVDKVRKEEGVEYKEEDEDDDVEPPKNAAIKKEEEL